MLEQVSASLIGEKEIEIKAVAALDLLVFDRMEEPIVSGYESEEVDWDAFRSAPGMVGYVVQEKKLSGILRKSFLQPSRQLWKLTKRNRTGTNRRYDFNSKRSILKERSTHQLVLSGMLCIRRTNW